MSDRKLLHGKIPMGTHGGWSTEKSFGRTTRNRRAKSQGADSAACNSRFSGVNRDNDKIITTSRNTSVLGDSFEDL